MNRIFKTENFPFLLVALFGIVSYCITHIVDRLTSLPIVKYRITRESSKNQTTLSYLIENITNNKTFEQTTFYIAIDPTDTTDSILAATPKFFPPMIFSSPADSFRKSTRDFSLFIRTFGPNSSFIITLNKRKPTELPLRISSKSTIYLSKGSYKTLLLEYEPILLATIAACCIAIIIRYMFKLS
jgi:hypothetical protein